MLSFRRDIGTEKAADVLKADVKRTLFIRQLRQNKYLYGLAPSFSFRGYFSVSRDAPNDLRICFGKLFVG